MSRAALSATPLTRKREVVTSLADARADAARTGRAIAEVVVDTRAAPRRVEPPCVQDATDHWVYGRATRDVCGEDGVVVHQGARALFVYPMRENAENGNVEMRCKTVDGVTAQLAYTWVTVYDAASAEHVVTDFGLI